MYDELYEKAKAIIRDGVCIKFCNEKEPPYLEKDASVVGLGTGFYRSGAVCGSHRDEVSKKTVLQPIAFEGKSLANRNIASKYRKRSIRHTLQPWEIPPLLFFPRGHHSNMITNH